MEATLTSAITTKQNAYISKLKKLKENCLNRAVPSYLSKKFDREAKQRMRWEVYERWKFFNRFSLEYLFRFNERNEKHISFNYETRSKPNYPNVFWSRLTCEED